MKTEKGEIAFFGPLLVVRGYGDAFDLYTDLSAFFATLRPVKTNNIGRKYPETTVADARQVIELFTARAKQARKDSSLVRDAIEGWGAFVTAHTAMIALRGLEPRAVYPENDRLWTHELRRLAIRVSAERATRPEDKTLVGSFVDSATALPGRIADAVSGGADEVSDVADAVVKKAGDAIDAVGGAIKDAGRFTRDQLPRLPSLFDPTRWLGELKWPLIVGAGVLGGVVLLPYVTDRREVR
jgi:hypothetical protein